MIATKRYEFVQEVRYPFTEPGLDYYMLKYLARFLIDEQNILSLPYKEHPEHKKAMKDTTALPGRGLKDIL
jgi:hypothetical protein